MSNELIRFRPQHFVGTLFHICVNTTYKIATFWKFTSPLERIHGLFIIWIGIEILINFNSKSCFKYHQWKLIAGWHDSNHNLQSLFEGITRQEIEKENIYNFAFLNNHSFKICNWEWPSLSTHYWSIFEVKPSGNLTFTQWPSVM